MTLVRRLPTDRINGSRAAYYYLEDFGGDWFGEGNTMKSKALAVQSILEVTENRAKGCPVSGHPPFHITAQWATFGFFGGPAVAKNGTSVITVSP